VKVPRATGGGGSGSDATASPKTADRPKNKGTNTREPPFPQALGSIVSPDPDPYPLSTDPYPLTLPLNAVLAS